MNETFVKGGKVKNLFGLLSTAVFQMKQSGLSGPELLSPAADWSAVLQRHHQGAEITNSTNSPEDNFVAQMKAA